MQQEAHCLGDSCSPTKPVTGATARSNAQMRDSAAMVVLPGGRADVSMDLSRISSYRKPIKVTPSSTKSADIQFPMT